MKNTTKDNPDKKDIAQEKEDPSYPQEFEEQSDDDIRMDPQPLEKTKKEKNKDQNLEMNKMKNIVSTYLQDNFR